MLNKDRMFFIHHSSFIIKSEMAIVLTGLSHKTAPVEVRECLALSKEKVGEALGRLVDGRVVREALIVSTCNRVEVLAVVAAGRVLHRLMHHAFHAAKRVRSETEIASAAVSVSYAAVELGRKILGTLEGRTVLLVGAGEMAELAARHLASAGASTILVANRTYETALRLAAEFGGEAVAYERFPHFLAEADVVVCSTGARKYIITEQMARAARKLRRNRPS